MHATGGSSRPPRPGFGGLPNKSGNKTQKAHGDTKSTKGESFVPFVAPFCAFCVPAPDFAVSELEPQRELDLALAVRGFSNDPGRTGNLTARENDQLGVSEVRVIEDVEGLEPELHIQLLLQRNPLEQRG